MNKTVIVVIVLALLVGLGVFVASRNATAPTTPPVTTTDDNGMMEDDDAMMDDDSMMDDDGSMMEDDGMMEEGDSMMEEDDAEDTEDEEMGMEEAEFEIEGSNYEFSVEEIRVKKGTEVEIELTSVEGFHDWVIDEFDARADRVNEGESSSVEFVADQVGTFEYYCSVGNHRQLGMVGTLIVEE